MRGGYFFEGGGITSWLLERGFRVWPGASLKGEGLFSEADSCPAPKQKGGVGWNRGWFIL